MEPLKVEIKVEIPDMKIEIPDVSSSSREEVHLLGGVDLQFSDQYLLEVPIKAFNTQVRNLDLSQYEIIKWKARRRTVKNRVYKRNSLEKRNGDVSDIRAENLELRSQLSQLEKDCGELVQRCKQLQAKVEKLQGTKFHNSQIYAQGRCTTIE